MAKRGRKPKPKPAPVDEAPKTEERSSFLPGEAEPAKEDRPDVTVAVEEDSNLETAQGITLSVRRGEDRRLEVALTIPPLDVWVEREVWPVSPVAPEHIAGKIAAAIERAAHTLAHDAAVQYAKRINEEAEAKERFARRG